MYRGGESLSRGSIYAGLCGKSDCLTHMEHVIQFLSILHIRTLTSAYENHLKVMVGIQLSPSVDALRAQGWMGAVNPELLR